jgi:hypothetical protein
VMISADSTSVASGGSATLSWSASNATSCTASNGWTGSKSAQGSLAVGPLTASTTYMLTCTGAGGSSQNSVTISVTAAASSPPPASSPPTAQAASSSSESSGGGGAIEIFSLFALLSSLGMRRMAASRKQCQ